MNFYKHHLGDYAQATAHLTFVEDAAYSRLIRKYYAEEKPLPLEIKAIHRLVGARTKEEKQAVEDVLEEFFLKTSDGWRNKRCDEEIERANAQAETNRLIAQAREERKRARIEHELSTNRAESNNESSNESPASREPSQTPDTRLQTKPTESKALFGNIETQTQAPEPKPEQSQARKKLSEACVEVLNFLNEKTGRNYQPVKANINLIAARIKEGATVIQCRQVIAKKCREWRDDPNREIYLRPKTLFNATNFAQYQGELLQNMTSENQATTACICCGKPWTKRIGGSPYCQDHDQHSQRVPA